MGWAGERAAAGLAGTASSSAQARDRTLRPCTHQPIHPPTRGVHGDGVSHDHAGGQPQNVGQGWVAGGGEGRGAVCLVDEVAAQGITGCVHPLPALDLPWPCPAGCASSPAAPLMATNEVSSSTEGRMLSSRRRTEANQDSSRGRRKKAEVAAWRRDGDGGGFAFRVVASGGSPHPLPL